jgi:putative membrane protein
MHLGRKYRFPEYLLWMRRETTYLFLWAVFVTAFFEILRWDFLSVPSAVLAVVGTAVAIILGFKNQQCYARINEAQVTWGQINSASMIWASKLISTIGDPAKADNAAWLKPLFYRHFAWLTVLRFTLRAEKVWENTYEPGNAKYLAALPTPESQSKVEDELKAYLSDDELEKVVSHRGDKETLLLNRQYRTIGDLMKEQLITPLVYLSLTNVLDDIVRLQGTSKRIKNYPYARNYYSIALILVKLFVVMLPLALYAHARDLGKPFGLEHWTAWLNVVFSVVVGWIFVTLEKVGENSSNPFEGGPNDVPISAMSRRIEIEMRTLLGEHTDLKPIEAKHNILF